MTLVRNAIHLHGVTSSPSFVRVAVELKSQYESSIIRPRGQLRATCRLQNSSEYAEDRNVHSDLFHIANSRNRRETHEMVKCSCLPRSQERSTIYERSSLGNDSMVIRGSSGGSCGWSLSMTCSREWVRNSRVSLYRFALWRELRFARCIRRSETSLSFKLGQETRYCAYNILLARDKVDIPVKFLIIEPEFVRIHFSSPVPQ